jgi:hypothetical protein
MTNEERHRHFYEVVNPRLDTLARLICEASSIEDHVLEESRYRDLLAFYEEQVRRGYWHPGLTESLADFTASRDPQAALAYYRQALDQARVLDAEKHTILIWMAKCLFELGCTEQAEAALHDGRAEALRRGCHDDVQEADRVLREASA